MNQINLKELMYSQTKYQKFVLDRFIKMELEFNKCDDLELEIKQKDFQLWVKQGKFSFNEILIEELIVGYVIHGIYSADSSFIYDIYIEPQYRNKGIARFVVQEILKTANVVIFNIYSSDIDAIRFWKRLGAKYDVDKKEYYLNRLNNTAFSSIR